MCIVNCTARITSLRKYTRAGKHDYGEDERLISGMGIKPVNSYNKTAILLHWSVAFILMAQFLIGLDMVDIPKGPDSSRAFWFNIHKSVGILLGCLILFRLYWRFRSEIPEMPDSSARWERVTAKLSHMTLYLCMLLMPISGLVGSLFSKYDLVFVGIKIPNRKCCKVNWRRIHSASWGNGCYRRNEYRSLLQKINNYKNYFREF